MDNGAFILIILTVLAAAFIVRSAIKNLRIPATSADWYVVFDIDAEKKVLILYFYPVVALEQRDNQTIAITSRPDVTRKLAAAHPGKIVNKSMWGVSVSHGCWFRDGVPLDESGSPRQFGDSDDFSGMVGSYLLGDFKLHLATPVPVFYQEQIKAAVERVKREA
ncbi:MAG: hypothetical protein RL710_679 [Pseudomonadota bacterium]|jgi:hypothetical protein